MDDAEFRALLAQFEIHEVDVRSVLASGPDDLRRGWKTALDRAGRWGLEPTMTTWVQDRLGRLATEEATDATRALAAETEAALRLSWLAKVARVPEGKQPTCDFRVGGLNVEVYCPQEHGEERRVVQAELAAQLAIAAGPVKVAITVSHPTTGSGRKVTEAGRVVRDPQNRASIFPVNKLIDRVLSAKRAATQFSEGQPNLLWLDLKHGLGLFAASCLPLRSIIAKGTCFVGMNGVWQAFYGGAGDPLFSERTPLEYPLRPGAYEQQRAGWFRDVREVSSAMVSVLDGLIRFDNPWATVPLGGAASALVMTLSDLRPEFSWFDEELQTLDTRVEAERKRIAWMARSRPET